MPPQDWREVQQYLNRLPRLADLKDEDFMPEGGWADRLAQVFTQKGYNELKATQLRKFFSLIKRIDRRIRDSEDAPIDSQNWLQIMRILPLLAYARGRDNIPEGFHQIMKTILKREKIQTVRDFRRLVQFMEALVAYHKYHEELNKPRGRGGEHAT